MFMNVVNKGRRDLHRFNSARGIEPAVASTKTEHLRDAVAVVQFVKELTDYVVQPRAQTTACHDTGTRVFRIEEKLRPRTRQFELESRIRADLDPLRDANIVAGRVTFRGGKARFTERGRIHRKRKIASTCAERMRRTIVRV